jgi:ATP-binding cassette, subfamily B, heavy metal transporter
MTPNSGTMKTAKHQYGPFLLTFIALAILNATVQFADLWAQRIFGRVIDDVIAWRLLAWRLLVAKLSILVLEVLVACLIGLLLRKVIKLWSIKKIEFDLPMHVGLYAWRRLFSISIGCHDMQHSGVMEIAMHRGQRSISTLAIMAVQEFLYVALRIAITTGAVIYLFPPCGVVVVFGIVGFFVLTWYVNSRFKANITTAQEAASRRDKLLGDISRNIGIVQLNAQEARVEAEIVSAFRQHAEKAKSVFTGFQSWSFGPGAVPTVARTCVLTVAVFLVARGEIKPGALVVCTMWASDVLEHLQWMHGINQSFMDQVIALGTYFRLLDSAPVPAEVSHAVQRHSFQGYIEFKNVSFQYPNVDELVREDQNNGYTKAAGRPWAVKNVSFTVTPGERVAIIGPSGAGKSTLVKLLLRLYDPDEGQILIDGIDIRKMNVKELRQAIGVVEQNVTLFNRSMRENILFGLDMTTTVEEDWISEVIRISRIKSVIEAMPSGLETCLGENGARLSGGERQRVGIARALAKKPTILLFDEAMSQLDGENEAIVSESICESCRGRTVLTIAHQLQTFINSDRIVILDKGGVVAEGNHEHLLAKSYWYRGITQSPARALSANSLDLPAERLVGYNQPGLCNDVSLSMGTTQKDHTVGVAEVNICPRQEIQPSRSTLNSSHLHS